MLYRHAFDIISNELRGIVRFLVNFEGFRGLPEFHSSVKVQNIRSPAKLKHNYL